ncbi:uncharacterized protein LOC144124368 [Amblyomma americanum]
MTTSAAVHLARLACLVGSTECSRALASSVANLIIDNDFLTTVAAVTSVAPDAVACYMGSQVADPATFDAKTQGAPLKMLLAFSSCVPKGIADDKIEKAAETALQADLTGFQVRVSEVLRQAVLKELAKITEEAKFKTAVKNAAILRAVRTQAELDAVKAYGQTTFQIPATDTVFQDVAAALVANAPLLQAWIRGTP